MRQGTLATVFKFLMESDKSLSRVGSLLSGSLVVISETAEIGLLRLPD